MVKVKHQCSGASVCVTLADCGPNVQDWCSEQTCCNGECRTHRVIDLTPAAFSVIGSLSSGLVPVYIYE